MEKENCLKHGRASRDSLYWTRSYLTDFHGPGGNLQGNKRPQDPTMYGQTSGSICLMHRSARNSKSGLSRKQNSIMPEVYVVFSLLNLMMNESNVHWKMLVESWEIPISAAMPCRLQLYQHRETCGTVGQHKTKYACIVEADESMRIRMEGSHNKNHEYHVAEKFEFIEALRSCAQIFAYAWSHENTR